MAKDTESIKCVILTLRRENVIVPNALVAEIISVKDIETSDGGPDWFLGNMKWRGADVPLLSFEASGGEKVSKVNLNTQAVVLYAVGDADDLGDHPYLGLVMSGVPHVSHFTRKQVKSDFDDGEPHPMVAQKIRINGASVSILDVDAMVAMVEEAAA
ncbi:MAG: chemotaxis protein CheW [Gammaproteobacteria bacterium]|nr:chemotaxis protein CheW [Gammaproteobacteria bacterium]